MLGLRGPSGAVFGLGGQATSHEVEKRILSLRKGGKGILKIAKELGIGTSVVQRVVNTP
jgi:hypothetical protein